MKLSVVIPVYNEKGTILELLLRVEKAELPAGWSREIIIIDDCSTDGTGELLKGVRHRVLRHARNQGKGAALRDGFAVATGDVILVQDADLEYSPDEYKSIIQPFSAGDVDVVFGYRRIRMNRLTDPLIMHYFGNKFLTLATNIIYGSRLKDMETCYKAFRRGLLEKITFESNRFDFEPEFTAKVLKGRYRLVQVPVQFNPRSVAEGKKISWKDGLVALWVLVKLRFSSRRF